MTQQSYINYIANIHCGLTSLAYKYCNDRQKGKKVANEEMNKIKLLSVYLDILEGYTLPQIEDTIKSDYDSTVLSAISFDGTYTHITCALGSLVTNITTGDSCVLLFKGVYYQATVNSFTYSAGDTLVVIYITGDYSTIITAGFGYLSHYRDNTLDSDEELVKNCLTPDQMKCIANHINHICSVSYSPDFLLTTNA
ncbi:hypothetical protein CCP3SC1AL1_310010 [Gammaproteobacteria bacterium]